VDRMILPPGFIDGNQFLIDAEILVFPKTVYQIFYKGRIDRTAGTCSAAVKVKLDPPEYRNTLLFSKRQHTVFIFQKHRAFRRCFPAAFSQLRNHNSKCSVLHNPRSSCDWILTVPPVELLDWIS